MNQTARPKAFKCIWQSGFTTSTNHQTFGHASSRSRMIQDSVSPGTVSNPNSPFSRFSRFPFWEVELLTSVHFIRIVTTGLQATLSQFSSFFSSQAKSSHHLTFWWKKVSTLWTLMSVASSLDPNWAADVYVAPSTGSRRRLRSSVQRTQRTAPACFGSVKEGVTWEEEWMDGSILSAQWIPS